MDECPICKSSAQVEPGTFDGYTMKCQVHGEFEFSDTVKSTHWNEPRGAWEQLTKARERTIKTTQHETVAGRRPRILDSDF
jgi:hypothetical protein